MTTSTIDLQLIKDIVHKLSPEDQAELDELIGIDAPLWVPLPGPQTLAYYCAADVLFYGGAAGGGKTDLAIGLALTSHIKSIIFRREGTQLQGIVDRMTEILGGRDGYNGQERIWRTNGRQVEFGATQHPGDETKYQGRPHDLKVFDEICHFQELMFRFLSGWLRSTIPDQTRRILCTGNPPTDAQGEWVREYWGPWLMDGHKHQAAPGDLVWFAMLDGHEEVVEDGKPFKHGNDLITPQSRTFIPSSVEDNAFLMETGYKATLQALPEPLRSQMLQGDFSAGLEDPAWQVIPSAWVQAAMDRWQPTASPPPMDSMGVDPARGGRDEMIIARRHGLWFAEPVAVPGKEVPDGPTAAAQVIQHRRDRAPVHIDIIGIGSSPYDFLVSNTVQTVGVNNASKSYGMDASNKLAFVNKRAETYWYMREALDPVNGLDLALPPSPRLRADLCTPLWKLTPRGIQIELKEEIIKRLGRSPDYGDAYVLALIATERDEDLPWNVPTTESNYEPL